MGQPAPPIIEQPTTPITFFEAVANQGHNNGIFNIALVASRFRAAGSDGGVRADVVCVADLRTTREGLTMLRNAIDAALLLAVPLDTDSKTAN